MRQASSSRSSLTCRRPPGPAPALSAIEDSDMNAQKTFQRICAYSGIICVLLFFGGIVAAVFRPPRPPSMSAAQVAAHYQAHTAGIRLGAGLIFLSSGFYVWFTAGIAG